MKIIILVTGIIIAKVSCWTITTPPEDTVVEAGCDVTLKCEVVKKGPGQINGVEWEHLPDRSLNPTHIFTNFDTNGNRLDQPANSEKYGIVGQYDLVVKDPQPADGGMYRCRLLLSPDQSYSAKLVVVGEVDVGVSSLDEGAEGTLSCASLVGGPYDQMDSQMVPKMRMKLNDQILTEECSYTEDESTAGQHVLELNYQYVGNALDDGASLTCEVYTDDMTLCVPVVKTLAVRHGTTSISVMTGVEGMTVGDGNEGDTFYVGDVLNCTADGNPAPQVRWLKVQSSSNIQEISSPELVLDDDMLGDNTWSCEASNSYNGQPYVQAKGYTFVVAAAAGGSTSAKSASLSPGLIVVAVVVPVVVIAVIVVGVFFLFKRRASKSLDSGNGTGNGSSAVYHKVAANNFPLQQQKLKDVGDARPEEAEKLSAAQPHTQQQNNENPYDPIIDKIALESVDENKSTAPKPQPRRTKSQENLARSRENLRHPPSHPPQHPPNHNNTYGSAPPSRNPQASSRNPPYRPGADPRVYAPRPGRDSTAESVMSDSDNYPKVQRMRPNNPLALPDDTSTPRSETPDFSFSMTSDTDADSAVGGGREGRPMPRTRTPRKRSVSRERPVGIKALHGASSLNTSRDTDV